MRTFRAGWRDRFDKQVKDQYPQSALRIFLELEDLALVTDILVKNISITGPQRQTGGERVFLPGLSTKSRTCMSVTNGPKYQITNRNKSTLRHDLSSSLIRPDTAKTATLGFPAMVINGDSSLVST